MQSICKLTYLSTNVFFYETEVTLNTSFCPKEKLFFDVNNRLGSTKCSMEKKNTILQKHLMNIVPVEQVSHFSSPYSSPSVTSRSYHSDTRTEKPLRNTSTFYLDGYSLLSHNEKRSILKATMNFIKRAF